MGVASPIDFLVVEGLFPVFYTEVYLAIVLRFFVFVLLYFAHVRMYRGLQQSVVYV